MKKTPRGARLVRCHVSLTIGCNRKLNEMLKMECARSRSELIERAIVALHAQEMGRR